MRHRLILVAMIICVVVSGILATIAIINTANKTIDMVEVNKIKTTVDLVTDFSDFQFESSYDFTVILTDGSVVYSTIQTDTLSFTERVNNAIKNSETVLDYGSEAKGKIIIYTSSNNLVSDIVLLILPLLFLCVLIIGYYIYLRIYLYSPFKRLKTFAAHVSYGNFDLALPMDKDNLFGEFTESFDIMREELKAAKQKAFDEERSKKELIATLSHDIKTPIASVRVASDLLEITEKDEKKLKNIKTIQEKTLEIDTLITDLFSSALEDLSELRVEIKDISSTEIVSLIEVQDPFKKVEFASKMPECLVRGDALRLGQVFSNIISNSYKYAKTKVEVSNVVVDNYLEISFKDFGLSLDKREMPLLQNRFYRGSNAKSEQGAGLGLYICSRLLERMGGSISFKLEPDGFRVIVSLILS